MNLCSDSLVLQQVKSKDTKLKQSKTKFKKIRPRNIKNRRKISRILSQSNLVHNKNVPHCYNQVKFLTPPTTPQSENSSTILILNDDETDDESLELNENIQNHPEISNTYLNEEEAQLKRALYNSRQLPLIPFVIDIDYRSLLDLSQQQNDLLLHIVTLLNNIDEESSFFEQFKV